MVVAVLANHAREEAGGGGVVPEGFLDARHEVREGKGFFVGYDAGEGDGRAGDFGDEAGVDVRVGEDLEEAGAHYCCCCVGAGEELHERFVGDFVGGEAVVFEGLHHVVPVRGGFVGESLTDDFSCDAGYC